MINMSVRYGSGLKFTVEQVDEASEGATFIAHKDNDIIEVYEPYVDGIAAFEIEIDERFERPNSEQDTREYEYQINEEFDATYPDIYPDVSDCDGGCLRIILLVALFILNSRLT